MEKIKTKWREIKCGVTDSLRGISKASLGIALWLETLLLLLTIAICLLCSTRLVISESMTQHALTLYRGALSERDTYEAQSNNYKTLYEKSLDQQQKEVPPQPG